MQSSYNKQKGKAKTRSKSKTKKRTYDRVSRTLNPKASGEELKFVEYTGDYTSHTVGEISLLNGIPSGAHVNARIGNRIEMKTLRLRMVPEYSSDFTASTSPPGHVRCVVLYDRSNNGLTPDATSMFGMVFSGSVAVYNENMWLAGVSVPNRERFVILADEIFEYPAAVYSGAAPNRLGVSENELPTGVTKYGKSGVIERFIKLKNLQTTYKGATSGGGDCTSGALWLVMLSDTPGQTTPATQPYHVFINARLVYGDR